MEVLDDEVDIGHVQLAVDLDAGVFLEDGFQGLGVRAPHVTQILKQRNING